MKASVKIPSYNWEPYKQQSYPVAVVQFSTTAKPFRRLRYKRYWFETKSIIYEDTNTC